MNSISGVFGVVSVEEDWPHEVVKSMISKVSLTNLYVIEQFLSKNRFAVGEIADFKTGNQLVFSKSNIYSIAFDGVVYNIKFFENLLTKENIQYHNSQQAILLESIELMGILWVLEKINGKFSIVIIDKKDAKIILARDRIGLNNIYYGTLNQKFLFSSNLKAFNVYKDHLKIARSSVGLYLQYSSIPAPYTIYEKVYKLEPGEYLIYDLKTNTFDKNKYWNLLELYQHEPLSELSDKAAVGHLNTLINESVESQTRNIKSVGAYLSGGIDSSTIASVMQSQSQSPIQTFSIGFDDKAYNEAEYAKEIAKHLGTDHNEVIIRNQDLFDVLLQIPAVYDEPFSESSQIPTFLANSLAKQHVDVVLTGDAGDELFGGYKRYHFVNKLNHQLGNIPGIIKTLGKQMDKIPVSLFNTIFTPLRLLKGQKRNEVNYGDKLLKGISLLSYKDRTELYHKGFMSHNNNVHSLLNNFSEVETVYSTVDLKHFDFYNEMLLLDLLIYLPNSNIKKVSAIAHYFDLDSRTPLLDNDIVDFAINLPISLKIRSDVDKWILKEVLYQYVPESYFDRPKKGFSVPLSAWLRGPLKDWAYELLFNSDIKEQGLFNIEEIKKYWIEHQSNKRNWAGILWDLIMFQAWMKHQKDN